VALALFFVSWAAIAARPWQERSARKPDPKVLALNSREKQLRKHALALQLRLKREWSLYEQRLAVRRAEIAAAELEHRRALAAAAEAAARAAAARAQQQPTRTARRAAAPVQERGKRPPASEPVAPPAPEPSPEPPPPPPAPPPPQVVVVELPPITVSSSS
jgi:hypothetical protein